MSRFAAILTSILLTLGAANFAHADALDAGQVPADAKWVLHVDMDAICKTKAWDTLGTKLLSNPKLQDGLSKIQAITGLDFPKGLHDVTLYGRSADEMSGVVIIHADADQDRILGLLEMNAAFGTSDYGKHQILTWHDDDKDKTMYGAFYGDSHAIIGRSEDVIKSALDTMDKKGESQKADSPLVAGAKAGQLIFVSGVDLVNLRKANKAQSPIIEKMDAASIALGEDGANVVVHASITAKSPEAAQQMKSAMEGIKAIVSLNGSDTNADPKAKIAATALMTLTAKVDGASVNVEWPIPADLIGTFIDQAHKSPDGQ